MGIIERFAYETMVGDPDDHRPNTEWALVFDPPADDGSHVRDLICIFERMGPGDAIPLHAHDASELVVIDKGRGTYQLGDERWPVGGGSVVFIPAGTPHGLTNDGGDALSLHAVFPSSSFEVAYLERNPAPGTEGDAPQPPARFGPSVEM